MLPIQFIFMTTVKRRMIEYSKNQKKKGVRKKGGIERFYNSTVDTPISMFY